MRISLVPLVLVAAMAASSTVMAMETAHGSITKLDAKKCTLNLSDSKATYHVPACDFSKLKIGQKVSVSWLAAANIRLASGIKAE